MISSIRCKCLLIKQLIIKWGIFFFPRRISEGQSVCCTHKSNMQASFRGELRGQGQRRRAGTDVAAAVGPQEPPQQLYCHEEEPELKVSLSGSDRQERANAGFLSSFHCFPKLDGAALERGSGGCTGKATGTRWGAHTMQHHTDVSPVQTTTIPAGADQLRECS